MFFSLARQQISETKVDKLKISGNEVYRIFMGRFYVVRLLETGSSHQFRSVPLSRISISIYPVSLHQKNQTRLPWRGWW